VSEGSVEVAHEALLREWTRLRDWIDASRDDLRLRARIFAAATEWTEAERSHDHLLIGARLAQVEEATARPDPIRLSDTERDYVDASRARRDAEVAAERIRSDRELALERRARTRLRGLVAC
jgi:hypothetical protein